MQSESGSERAREKGNVPCNNSSWFLLGMATAMIQMQQRSLECSYNRLPIHYLALL